MKKISIIAAAAIVMVSSMTSCNASVADKGKAQNSIDTLSIKIGELYGYGIAQQTTRYDSTFNKDEFIRGFEMAVNVDTANDSYRQGMIMGSQLIEMVKGLKKQNNIDLNTYLLLTEFKKAYTSDSLVDPMTLQGMVNVMMEKEIRAAKEKDPKAIANREAGEKFMKELTSNDTTVKVTASGLAYKVIKKGNGKLFKTTDRILVKYKGSKIDGSVFDQSEKPMPMSALGVVPGFKEGLLMMSPGASYILYVPSDLAYGIEGRMPRIEPNETLIFEVETVGVDEAKKK